MESWSARSPTAKNQNADVKLLNLTKKVKDVLQVTKLYTVFDIYDDEAHAISSLQVTVRLLQRLKGLHQRSPAGVALFA